MVRNAAATVAAGGGAGGAKRSTGGASSNPVSRDCGKVGIPAILCSGGHGKGRSMAPWRSARRGRESLSEANKKEIE